jgi:hypothetical protein
MATAETLLRRFAVGDYSIVDEDDRQNYFEALHLLDQAKLRREQQQEADKRPLRTGFAEEGGR